MCGGGGALQPAYIICQGKQQPGGIREHMGSLEDNAQRGLGPPRFQEVSGGGRTGRRPPRAEVLSLRLRACATGNGLLLQYLLGPTHYMQFALPLAQARDSRSKLRAPDKGA